MYAHFHILLHVRLWKNPMPSSIRIDNERKIAPTGLSLDEANTFVHLYRRGVHTNNFLHHQFVTICGKHLQGHTVSLSLQKNSS